MLGKVSLFFVVFFYQKKKWTVLGGCVDTFYRLVNELHSWYLYLNQFIQFLDLTAKKPSKGLCTLCFMIAHRKNFS